MHIVTIPGHCHFCSIIKISVSLRIKLLLYLVVGNWRLTCSNWSDTASICRAGAIGGDGYEYSTTTGNEQDFKFIMHLNRRHDWLAQCSKPDSQSVSPVKTQTRG